MDHSLETLLRAANQQDVAGTRAAARLMSMLENHPECLPDFIHAVGRDAPMPRLILGITGAPGSGKSTLTNAIVAEYRRRNLKMRLGVVAVDPSSPFSGGAVLGDRVRMMRHAMDSQVYVRSLASRGHLGGLSLGVKGVLRVMGYIGADVVIIETVGVGQSEVEIARVADFVTVILAPGQGDSIQLLKAGLLEVGDLLIVNKADRPDAHELQAQLRMALKREDKERKRDLIAVSATEESGIDELVDRIEKLSAERSHQRKKHRQDDLRNDVREAVLEIARQRLLAQFENEQPLQQALEEVVHGKKDAQDVVDLLLKEPS